MHRALVLVNTSCHRLRKRANQFCPSVAGTGPPLPTFDGLVAERSRIETQLRVEIVKHHLNRAIQAKARPVRQLPRLLTCRVQAPLETSAHHEHVANLGATLEALTKVRAPVA